MNIVTNLKYGEPVIYTQLIQIFDDMVGNGYDPNHDSFFSDEEYRYYVNRYAQQQPTYQPPQKPDEEQYSHSQYKPGYQTHYTQEPHQKPQYPQHSQQPDLHPQELYERQKREEERRKQLHQAAEQLREQEYQRQLHQHKVFQQTYQPHPTQPQTTHNGQGYVIPQTSNGYSAPQIQHLGQEYDVPNPNNGYGLPYNYHQPNSMPVMRAY